MTTLPLSAEEKINFLNDELEIDGEVYDRLFEFYTSNGEMPYGTAKARDGDPHQWIYDQVSKELMGDGNINIYFDTSNRLSAEFIKCVQNEVREINANFKNVGDSNDEV